MSTNHNIPYASFNLVFALFYGITITSTNSTFADTNADDIVELLKANRNLHAGISYDVTTSNKVGIDIPDLIAAKKAFYTKLLGTDDRNKWPPDIVQVIDSLDNDHTPDNDHMTVMYLYPYYYSYEYANIRDQRIYGKKKPVMMKTIKSFNGNVWMQYSPDAKSDSGLSAPELNIDADITHDRWIHSAMGLGIDASKRFLNKKSELPISNGSRKTLCIGWEDLINLIDKSTINVVSNDDIDSDNVLLEMKTPKYGNVRDGLVRVRCWFNKSNDFRMTKLECATIEVVGGDNEKKEYGYLPLWIAEWMGDGLSLANIKEDVICQIRHYEHFPYSTDATDFNSLPHREYELYQTEYRINNIKLHNDITPESFTIVPAEGTNVIDESQGVRYLIGDTGKIIDRIALHENSTPEDAAAKKSASTRIFTIIALNIILAIVIIAIILKRRINIS